MSSKFFLIAVASVALISWFAVEGDSGFVFAQEDSKLEYDTFHQPSSILADGNLIFFTPANHDGLSSISIQDIKTGSLFKIQSPHKNLDDDWFGKHISLVGSNIAASYGFTDPQTNKWITLVHVFDVETGNLLYTIENPISGNMHFGYTLESLGDKLAVYSSDIDPNDDIHDNVVHVFGGKDSSLLYTIENPLDIGHFGKSLSTINNNFLTHTRQDANDNLSGVIHAFDADTGKLQYAIEHPQTDIRDADPYFGGQSIVSGNHVVVKSGDAAYVFDGMTGELRKTVNEPIVTNNQLDAILDSLEEPVQEKTYGDDAPFFGIFAYLDELFSWMMKQFGNEQDETLLTEQQIFENKKMELMVPEIDPQHCKELEEKNSTIGQWESDQERNDVRQTLDQCKKDRESIERLDEIVFENCDQFKEEYDGKISQKIHDKKGVELAKHILNDCKLRK